MARGIPECGQHLNCYLCVVRKIYSVTKEDTVYVFVFVNNMLKKV